MLDFTYSLYVAVHFAIEEAEKACAVWAIRAQWVINQSRHLLKNGKKDPDVFKRFCERQFGEGRERDIKHLFFDPPGVNVVCFMNPFHLNHRLRTQKGIFLVPGNIESTFMENLTAMQGHEKRRNVMKFVIPKDAKLRREIQRGLASANISRTSLFPGLDGFARSLGSHLPLLDPPDWFGTQGI